MAFIVETKTENGFNKVVLKDIITETSVEIIPACGAILHAFKVLHNGSFINVIEQYADADDFALNVATKGFKSCKLSPFACRIKDSMYNFDKEKYTIDKFILDGNAIHGLLYDAKFTVIKQEENNDNATIVLCYAYRSAENGYPFFYDCIISYSLQKENTLHIITEIINKDKRSIPLQDGWHPYFTLGGKIDDLELEFQSSKKILFNAAMIPTGERMAYQQYSSFKKIGDANFDDCFSVNFETPLTIKNRSTCILRNVVQKIQLEINPDKTYPFLQIYTPPHRNSIAIENLSAIPDAFNNGIGLITLPSQANTIFTTTYKITSLN